MIISDENKVLVFHKEIDLIQDCIKRMSSNSFYLKGWFISLIILSTSLLASKDIDIVLISSIALILTTIFWGLDAFFLKVETLYRWKYEWVIKERLKNRYDYLYDLNPYNTSMWLEPTKKKSCLHKFLFSKTLVPLYGIFWIVSLSLIVINLLLVYYGG